MAKKQIDEDDGEQIHKGVERHFIVRVKSDWWTRWQELARQMDTTASGLARQILDDWLRVGPEQLKEWQKVADEAGMTMSGLMRQLMRDYMERRERSTRGDLRCPSCSEKIKVELR